MSYLINGYSDMYTVFLNERKYGGAIQAEKIQLQSGETYTHPVFIHLDKSSSSFLFITFISEQGEKIMVNIHDISMIQNPEHVYVFQIQNEIAKERKIEEKTKILKKLCHLNEGTCFLHFQQEVCLLLQDLGNQWVCNFCEKEHIHPMHVHLFKKVV